MIWKPMELSGWGGTERVRVLASRPEQGGDVLAAFADAQDTTILARGAGRSYGDAALNRDGRVILTERLNRLISFDDTSGELVCEPGVTFRDLMRVFLGRGYLSPTSPGTAYTTVGGAVANDVHGKNHDRMGSFGDHVVWIDLALPSGEVMRVSRTQEPQVFAATIGGIGLTGFIMRVCFRMVRAPSARVVVHERRIFDLEEFIAALDESRERATFSVGWIDGLARGRHLGRGILQTAEFAEGIDTLARRGQMAPTVPVNLPGPVLNSLTVGIFNAAYLRHVPAGGRTREQPIDRFLYPLDDISHWNRIYGRRGFYQFQAVIPDEEGPTGIRHLLETITDSRAASFLDVLKALGSEGLGHLSFPLRGYTIAVDFPNRPGTVELLQRLEAVTLEHGGRVYLGKDAVLSPEGFREMYPRHEAFRAVLDRVDPGRRLDSDMARRLEIRA